MRDHFNSRRDKPTPLNEPTYLKIKKAIISDLVGGIFQPGDHLTIDMLTTRYLVSHMPIREALRQLEGEGILVSIAHRGFRLEEITEDYIRNIYDIRVGIESMLARRAVERATPADVAELVAIHEACCSELRTGSPKALETNILLHARLYALARNPEAEQLLEGRTRVVRTVGDGLGGYRPGVSELVIAEHNAIMEAFEAGCAEACGQAVFAHVTAARDRLLETLAEKKLAKPLTDLAVRPDRATPP